MVSSAVLVYPHQLFRDHPALKSEKTFILVEDPLFFTLYKFHKKKLILHRATMKMYEDFLVKKGKDVLYIESHQLKKTGDVFTHTKNFNEFTVSLCDDNWLETRLQKASAKHKKHITFIETPAFLTPLETAVGHFKNKKYFMGSFYQEQRKRFGILMDGKKPTGGKWSYDADNRKKLPKDIVVPELKSPKLNSYVAEATIYVEKYFSDNPGSAEDFNYPVTFKDADKWLQNFLNERFKSYGDYQDAISRDDSFLFHSVISPALNIGLLTPQQVVDKTIEQEDIPLNSLEGFIRQVIGWREYVRAVYNIIGSEQRTKNFWNHTRRLPDSFWDGSTGIEPIDTVIKRVLQTGYAHHIERLMVLGNFMLLSEFDPDDVYRWFMELFIDAYDWVMVPNVYGMSLYADGGMIVTKPYISSSNYVRKMSNFKKGLWCETWDGLYWSFVHKYRSVFEENHRSRMMIIQLDRMKPDVLKGHLKNASNYFRGLL